MTLNIGLLTPRGLWLCADQRVIERRGNQQRIWDDDSIKQIAYRCTNGDLLITYAGLGAIFAQDRWVHVSDWLRRTLTGYQGTVGEVVERIWADATRDLLPICLAHDVCHCFTVVGHEAGVPLLGVINNWPRGQMWQPGVHPVPEFGYDFEAIPDAHQRAIFIATEDVPFAVDFG